MLNILYSFFVCFYWCLEREVLSASMLYSFTIDMKGFEYVLKFFFKIEEIYHYFMEKYKPQAIHFEQQEAIKYELETYLKLYDAHQDVVNSYINKKA